MSEKSQSLLCECSESGSVPKMASNPCITGNKSQLDILPTQRSGTHVFEVRLVQGLLGLGVTLGSDDMKEVVIQHIRMFSPAAAQRDLRSAIKQPIDDIIRSFYDFAQVIVCDVCTLVYTTLQGW